MHDSFSLAVVVYQRSKQAAMLVSYSVIIIVDLKRSNVWKS